MSSLSSNLKTLMELAKINASELARRTGIAQPIIHRLSTGQNKNPKLATVKPLSEYFMVTVSQLIGEEALPLDQSVYRVSAAHQGFNRLPLLEWQAALLGTQAVSQQPNDQTAEFITTDANVSKAAYALRTPDQSMEPIFPRGTIVIIDPERSPKHRDFTLVQINGQSTACLRQMLVENQQTIVQALNADASAVSRHVLQAQDRLLGVMVQAKLDF